MEYNLKYMSDIILKTIKNPRVTEKVSNASAQNVYTFNIAVSANKKEVEKAVFSLYKVKPVKINILSIPPPLVPFLPLEVMFL